MLQIAPATMIDGEDAHAIVTTTKGNFLRVLVLLDTGAGGNFCSVAIAKLLKQNHECSCVNKLICSAFNTCKKCSYEYENVNIKFENKFKHWYLTLNITPLEDIQYDIVIGRRTIRKFDLWDLMKLEDSTTALLDSSTYTDISFVTGSEDIISEQTDYRSTDSESQRLNTNMDLETTSYPLLDKLRSSIASEKCKTSLRGLVGCRSTDPSSSVSEIDIEEESAHILEEEDEMTEVESQIERLCLLTSAEDVHAYVEGARRLQADNQTVVTSHMSEFLSSEVDTDGIFTDEQDPYTSDDDRTSVPSRSSRTQTHEPQDTDSCHIPTKIYGTPDFQERIREVC
jgi:hypothetical protein